MSAPSIVNIPGSLTATYFDGKIVDWTFSPHGSNAGYFGSIAWEESGDGELDVQDLDGPFWRAVQVNLANNKAHMNVEWSE